MGKTGKVILGVLVLGIVGNVVVGGSGSAGSSAAPASADTAADRRAAERRQDSELVVTAQLRMEKRLRDPESAKFEELSVQRWSGEPVVCGYVNAKNGFGGYTGRKAFVMAANSVPVGEDDVAEGVFVELWNSLCTEEGAQKAAARRAAKKGQ